MDKQTIRVKDHNTEGMIDLDPSNVARITFVGIDTITVDRHGRDPVNYNVGIDGVRRVRAWVAAENKHVSTLEQCAQRRNAGEGVTSQLEDLTRRAAHAIGKDVSLFEWDDAIQGLRLNSFGNPTFAPLTIYSDAFIVEATLQMSVEYRHLGNAITIHVSCAKHAEIAHMVSVVGSNRTDNEAMIKARMRLATTFAALIDLAENENAE